MKWPAVSICLVLLSCTKSPFEDPNACKQTYGFGNYGCSDVNGSVLSASNAPLSGVQVSGGGSTDPYEHFQTASDGTGHFTVRLLRRWVPPEEEPDTVTTWFHTIVPASGVQPSVHDSMQVQVRFYRLLVRPTPITVTLHSSAP